MDTRHTVSHSKKVNYVGHDDIQNYLEAIHRFTLIDYYECLRAKNNIWATFYCRPELREDETL